MTWIMWRDLRTAWTRWGRIMLDTLERLRVTGTFLVFDITTATFSALSSLPTKLSPEERP